MRELGHVFSKEETAKLRQRAVSCWSPEHPDQMRKQPPNGPNFKNNVLVFFTAT